jgi:hypothetical protein
MDKPNWLEHVWLEHITLLSWRIAGYATRNLIDDAAMLSLLFC